MIRLTARPLGSLITRVSARGFCDTSASSKMPTLFDSEGRVLPFDNSINHFSMFGLDKSFNVEISDVAQTFKNLQRQLHPDKVRATYPRCHVP